MTEMKRLRATAVVMRDGAVLLVRDRGAKAYSLPGGRRERGETATEAAARELREELGMRAVSVRRLERCDYESRHNLHQVSLVESDDEPFIADGELEAFTWWDRREPIDAFDHVRAILGRL